MKHKDTIARAIAIYGSMKDYRKATFLSREKLLSRVFGTWRTKARQLSTSWNKYKNKIKGYLKSCLVEWKKQINIQRNIKYNVIMQWKEVRTKTIEKLFYKW